MNKLNKQGKWGQIHRWRAGCSSWGDGEGVEGLRKKEKGLMDMNNRVMIVKGERYKGTKR